MSGGYLFQVLFVPVFVKALKRTVGLRYHEIPKTIQRDHLASFGRTRVQNAAVISFRFDLQEEG